MIKISGYDLLVSLLPPFPLLDDKDDSIFLSVLQTLKREEGGLILYLSPEDHRV